MRATRISLLFCIAAAVAALGLPATALARCGATERWFVKVGTDPDAALVRLDDVRSISVQGMNDLPSLRSSVPNGNEVKRLPEERVVYRVSARLVLYKVEEDGDYHLVITDDSLRYTPGGQGTEGQETGTSFIAEIPDPQCVAGKLGDLDVPSRFAQQLRDVRTKFEARFPGHADADSSLGGIPVTLEGIAFYDRQHLQTGRAVNGIELHPILDIRFDDQIPSPPPAPPVTPGGTISQLLVNPGFEDGATGWSGTREAIRTSERDADRGHGYAWLGGTGQAGTETLRQDVSIPARAAEATLSMRLSIETEETTPSKAYDKFYVQVRDDQGHVLETLAKYSNLNASPDYVSKTFDLTGFAGRTVQIYLKAVEDDGKETSFMIDDVTLTVR